MAESGGAATAMRWGGLFAPRGLPEAVGKRLNAALDRILRRADMRQRLNALGFEAPPSTRTELVAFVAAQQRIWNQMVVDAGLA